MWLKRSPQIGSSSPPEGCGSREGGGDGLGLGMARVLSRAPSITPARRPGDRRLEETSTHPPVSRLSRRTRGQGLTHWRFGHGGSGRSGKAGPGPVWAASSSLSSRLRLAPLIWLADLGIAHPLDQRRRRRVQFPCSRNGFRLGRTNGARPLRVWPPDGIVALRAPLHKQPILVHSRPLHSDLWTAYSVLSAIQPQYHDQMPLDAMPDFRN